jgi:predicted extracellular nuclease
VHTWISSPGSEIKRLFYTLNGKSYTTTINPQANDLLVSYSYDFSNVQVILGSNLDNILGDTKKVIEFSTWHINCTTKLEKSYNKTSIAE